MYELKKPEPWVDLIEYATDMLKKAEFVWHYTSRRSEACYYKFPGYNSLIRIAAHRYSFSARKAESFEMPVVSNLTFPPTYQPQSFENVNTRIYTAVGKYFIKGMENDK